MEYIDLWEKPPYYNKEYDNEENKNTPTIVPVLASSKKAAPCVIVVPGGGYTHRAFEKKVKVARVLREWGINAFVMNYRVYPYMYPTPMEDFKRAVAFLKENADKYSIDLKRMAAIGFSAGAHLTACAVLSDKSLGFHSLALCYPVVSLSASYAHKGSGEHLLGDDSDMKKELSLENADLSGMPPVFMWHTQEDKSVPVRNSLELALRLDEYNVPFEYHIFTKGRHGSALAEDIDGTRQWVSLYKNWLERIGFLV